MIELNEDEKEVLLTNRDKIRLKLDKLESSFKDDMSISSSASISFILSNRDHYKFNFE